jgi:DNA-binding NtrC family response regulator
MSFQIPPLGERRAEIPTLSADFVAEFAHQHGFNRALIAPRTLDALQSYAWPGNIRELRNVIERAVILSAGKTIEPAHLPRQVVAAMHDVPALAVRQKDSPPSNNKLANARQEAEREQLIDSLQRNDNNRSKTALDLGISRVALYKRLRKLHLL